MQFYKYTHTHILAPLDNRGRTQDGSGDGSGDGNNSSSGDGNWEEDEKGDENEDGIGGSGGEAKKRKKRTRVVDIIGHFHFARIVISAERGWRFRAPDNSVCKARNLYTCIVPWG